MKLIFKLKPQNTSLFVNNIRIHELDKPLDMQLKAIELNAHAIIPYQTMRYNASMIDSLDCSIIFLEYILNKDPSEMMSNGIRIANFIFNMECYFEGLKYKPFDKDFLEKKLYLYTN